MRDPVSSTADRPAPLQGVTFAKQFPNPSESLRGLFVAEQVRATGGDVAWRVIAPVPYIPRWLARILGKPFVHGDDTSDGVVVMRPRYAVLPRRLLYTTVARSMALGARRAWHDALAGHRPEFVHVHALYPSGAALRRLVRGTGVPYVVSIHGSDLYTNLTKPAWAEEVRGVLHDAAAVVCVSESLARDAIALAGADATRTVVIPDAYDEALFTYHEREAHAGPVRLISVGRLVPVKGHDVLVCAFASAVRDGLDATLDIVGGGPERARLEALVRAEGVADRVRLLGPLGESALRDALHAADAFVLASRREGFGVVIVEALATGLPVLATRSGGPVDIVGDRDGMLVEPDDVPAFASALVTLAAELGGFDRAEIATRVACRYSRPTIGRQLVDLYRAVVDHRPFNDFGNVG